MPSERTRDRIISIIAACLISAFIAITATGQPGRPDVMRNGCLNVAISSSSCPITMEHDLCSRGFNNGSNCLLGTAPDGVKAFEWEDGFYTTALDSTKQVCPLIPGISLQFYDGKNCYFGPKPQNGFVWKDKYFYTKFDACSRGSNDGNNCLLGTAPDGVKAFEWEGGFYTTTLIKPECPAIPGMPLQFYDGKNCYFGAKPQNSFVWKDKYFYMKYDACLREPNDGETFF